MNWRNLLYFSKGERRALTLLLFLISIAVILLLIDNEEAVDSSIQPHYIVSPGNSPTPIVQIDTVRNLAEKTDVSLRKMYSKNRKGNSSSMNRLYGSYTSAKKFPAGTVIELNTADTAILKQIPGIGSTFALRIVKYRSLLGGFYSVEQLKEIYGMDDERYNKLKVWFDVDTAFIAKLPVNYLPSDSLVKHPYVNYKQAKIIYQLKRQKGELTGWENLNLLDEFTVCDKERLYPYFLF